MTADKYLIFIRETGKDKGRQEEETSTAEAAEQPWSRISARLPGSRLVSGDQRTALGLKFLVAKWEPGPDLRARLTTKGDAAQKALGAGRAPTM